MPLPNMSQLVLYTPTPAFKNFGSGTFTVVVSGSITPGDTLTWSGSVSFSRANSLVKLYINQTPVPVDPAVNYTSSAYLPVPSYGTTAGSPNVYIGCSVPLDPSTTVIAASVVPTFTSSTLTMNISINNPTIGAMTLTTTTFIVSYRAFLPMEPFTPL